MMASRLRLVLPLIALFAVGAKPETFTREEFDRLTAEKRAAEARLEALESARDFAETDLADIDQRLISAAMESRRREEQASIAERKLIDLEARRQAARAELFAERERLDALLGALAISSRQRPPALVVAPDNASQSIRASVLMGAMAPRVKAETDELKAELKTLQRIEMETRRERARLETAEAVLDEKSAEIEQLAAAKRARFEDVSAEAEALRQKVEELSRQAGTLEQLLAGLEEIAPAAPGAKPAAPPKRQYASLPNSTRTSDVLATDPARTARPLDSASIGGMEKPAVGLVRRRYGEKTETGSLSEGVTIETREQAQVVAPVDGSIVFAGEFRSYGEMLILRTSDGYHVILSGLSQIYGAKDQWVTAGEPVGRMPGRKSPPPELYLEVRKDGRALDPSKWMKGG